MVRVRVSQQALWLALVAGFPAGAAGEDSTLVLRVFDERGRPTYGNLRLLDAQGGFVAIQTTDAGKLVPVHPNFPELGVVIEREARLSLSAGVKELVLDRGPEYRRARFPVNVKPGEIVEQTVKLERWIDMATRGWWSGDLHVHRVAAELPALMQAADLHFASAITCFNDASVSPWPATLTATAGSHRVYSIDNCEDERRWGAALFIGVNQPMRLYERNSEYPPPSQTWGEARKRGAFIDLEKAIWWQSPVVVALHPPDSIGVAVNHFTEDAVSTRASLARPRDESKYAGGEGFARYIVDLYEIYLSAGFRLPASAGSGNGVSRNPIGFNRSYVHLGEKFGYKEWLAGQKTGRNFVTNGPMLSFLAAGQESGRILPHSAQAITVEAECESRDELDRAEIVVDGEVIEVVRAMADAKSIRTKRRIRPRDGGWIAARCYEKNSTTVRLAHSSPVWIGNTPRRSSESLQYLREWVEADEARIRAIPDHKITESQRQELLAASRRAAEFYK
jgi:hypothetical protein